DDNIITNPISLNGGVTVGHNDWEGFVVLNLHNGLNNNINYDKYLEFRIAPEQGYKILLSQFKLQYFSPDQSSGIRKLQVRYSTDPTFPSNGILLDSEKTLTLGSSQSLNLNFPPNFEITQTLYLRVYMFGQIDPWYSRI